jgi:hypothetical protein
VSSLEGGHVHSASGQLGQIQDTHSQSDGRLPSPNPFYPQGGTISIRGVMMSTLLSTKRGWSQVDSLAISESDHDEEDRLGRTMVDNCGQVKGG